MDDVSRFAIIIFNEVQITEVDCVDRNGRIGRFYLLVFCFMVEALTDTENGKCPCEAKNLLGFCFCNNEKESLFDEAGLAAQRSSNSLQ